MTKIKKMTNFVYYPLIYYTNSVIIYIIYTKIYNGRTFIRTGYILQTN